VTAIHKVPADFVAAQIDAVFSDLDVGAVKIGMLAQAGIIEAVAAGLARWRQTRVVLDPVMVASSGDRLIDQDAVVVLKRELIPRVLVLTPNLPEAAALLDATLANTEIEMQEQARALLALGAQTVVLKGGHARGSESVDLVVSREQTFALRAQRIAAHNSHGTGCAFSSAIAAALAKGMSVDESVWVAKRYVHGALAAGASLKVGSGTGPIHHFHALWPFK
jgi:hydroxymethylpyrimidine/phosphomethylpyrimidine kinase